jgi:hypothetical protein
MRARRFFLAAFLTLAFAPAAFAQPELAPFTEDFLAGTWKFTMPGWERRGLTIRFGPGRDYFCRLDGPAGKVRAHCLGWDGTGIETRTGTRIRIAWGGMMRGLTMDLTLGALHGVRGTYAVRLLGLSWQAPGPVTGSRRPHRENVPDPGGQSALLGDILRSPGRASTLPGNAELPTAAQLRVLGRLQRVIHMGREDGAEIYSAEFFSGRRLCAIRQRPDGVIDRLRCV